MLTKGTAAATQPASVSCSAIGSGVVCRLPDTTPSRDWPRVPMTPHS